MSEPPSRRSDTAEDPVVVRSEEGALTFARYAEVGGVTGALARHAEWEDTDVCGLPAQHSEDNFPSREASEKSKKICCQTRPR